MEDFGSPVFKRLRQTFQRAGDFGFDGAQLLGDLRAYDHECRDAQYEAENKRFSHFSHFWNLPVRVAQESLPVYWSEVNYELCSLQAASSRPSSYSVTVFPPSFAQSMHRSADAKSPITPVAEPLP